MCFLIDHFQIDIVSTLIYLMAAKLEKSGRGKKIITTITKKIHILSSFVIVSIVFMMPALIYDNSYTYVQSVWR